MPEWYFVVAFLGILSLMGLFWTPLLWTLTLFVASLLVIVLQAFLSAYRNSTLPPEKRKWKYYFLTTVLHIIQPIARLYGRIKHGLTPWRKRGNKPSWKFLFVLRPQVLTYWSETWQPIEEWLTLIEKNLIGTKTRIQRGGDFDRWDLQLRNGIVSVNRALLTIEEHGAGRQFVRLKTWTLPSRSNCYLSGFILLLALLAFVNEAWIVSGFLAIIVMVIVWEYIADTAVLLSKLDNAFREAVPCPAPAIELKEAPIIEQGNPAYVVAHADLEKENFLMGKRRFVNAFRKIWFRA